MLRDSELKLFKYENNKWVTYGEIVQALIDVDADKCEVLFLHTELSFGTINPNIKRKELMEILYDAISELKIKTLVFPTFTFSYGNKENYDVKNSPSKMGMFNEYARKRPDSIRSLEPLLSVCVIGENKELVKVNGNHSLGKGSIFDNLHNIDNVRILFFGTRVGQCYTHMHYIEEKLEVPYRYNKEFIGKIIDYDGKTYEDNRILFVKYRDIIPVVPEKFEEILIEKGILKKIKLGNSSISCFTEKESYEETILWLKRDVNCFLGEPYNTKPLVKEYRYGNVTTVQ